MDADSASYDEENKRTSVSTSLLNGMPISCSYTRQRSVYLSTIEAEFVAVSKTAQELLRARESFRKLKMLVKESVL